VERPSGLLLIFLIVGGAASLWVTMTLREPSYRGKPLSFWLLRAEAAEVLDPKDPKFIECREAIRGIGTNAIPMLLRILRAKDSASKKAVLKLVEKQNFVRIPLRGDEEQKGKAQAGFYLLGELASNAVPAR
jgi:hypothetical protein